MKKCLIVSPRDSQGQQIYFLSDVVIGKTIAKRYSASGTYPVEIGHGRGFCPFFVTRIRKNFLARDLRLNVAQPSFDRQAACGEAEPFCGSAARVLREMCSPGAPSAAHERMRAFLPA